MFVASKQNGSGTKCVFQNSKDSESWQQFLTNEAPEKNQKRFEPVSMVEMVCIPKNHELFTYGGYHTENQPHLHSAHWNSVYFCNLIIKYPITYVNS